MTTTTLAQDRFGLAIQALAAGTVENLAFTAGSSTQSAALVVDTQVVRLCSDVDVWVKIGDNPTADATLGVRLPAGVVEYFRVPPGVSGPKVAARGIAAGGTLNIVQCDL